MIKKITLLLALLSAHVLTINSQTTFEWLTAVNNGNTITETIDGITLTFTGADDKSTDMLINDPAGYGGSSNNVAWELTLVTSVTLSFSEPVDINSILALNGNGFSNDYTFTTSDGDNDPVMVSIVEGTAPPVVLNWTDVTTITISAPITNQFGFDNLIINNEIVSTNEHTLEDVRIYPNPVQNFLNLENVENLESAKIYSASGQLVLETTDERIDFSNIEKGVYFIQLAADDAIITRRIVKD